MEVQLINDELLAVLESQAALSERKRVAFDLRTSPNDNSQRMLNSLQPGTEVAIHRHEGSDETNICLNGRLDVIFYVELPNMDAGGPGREFAETYRVTLCPKEGCYGVQIPKGVWHTILVYEVSTICEMKDGKYEEK